MTKREKEGCGQRQRQKGREEGSEKYRAKERERESERESERARGRERRGREGGREGGRGGGGEKEREGESENLSLEHMCLRVQSDSDGAARSSHDLENINWENTSLIRRDVSCMLRDTFIDNF